MKTQLFHSKDKKRAVLAFANSERGPFTAIYYVNCNYSENTDNLPAYLGDGTTIRRTSSPLPQSANGRTGY